jgi:localization factor PodJL
LIADLNVMPMPEDRGQKAGDAIIPDTHSDTSMTMAETEIAAVGQSHALVESPPLATQAEPPPMMREPPPVVADQKADKPALHPSFQAREAAQKILAKVEQAPQPEPQTKWPFPVPPPPRLAAAAAAILFLALAGSIGFVALGGLGRPAPTPPAPQRQAAARAPHVLVIDATGAAPDPMFQQTPPALRDVIVRARRGEKQAQVQLAQSFLKGDGFAADPIAAARWSDEAAAQGDATAQFILGTLYGEGIKPNPRLASAWFSAAASRGNVKAMHNLAIAYLNGTGVSQDAQAAAIWFEKAASAGYRDSAFDLAVLYERGDGVKQSGRDALKWYEQAAAQGDPEAMHRATYLREQLRPIVAKR